MRVTLDTNIWSRLAERDEIAQFEELEDALGVQLVIPPSTLLEALRTRDALLRSRIVDAITSRGRTRIHLPTEARMEADELIAEIRRARPNWLRPNPDPGSLDQLNEFWTRRVYQKARADPEAVAGKIDEGPGEHIHEVQRENQLKAREDSFDITKGEPWVVLEEADAETRLGWDGSRVMAWRVECAQTWWWQLTHLPRRRRLVGDVSFRFDTTMFDWVQPVVNTASLARDRTAWNRFWYLEVEQLAVPRNWMRILMPHAQLAWRLGTGEPRDAQHAAYLFDTDVLITADKRYAWALDLVRQWTKTSFARVALMEVPERGSTSIVTSIERLLNSA